MAGKLDTNVVLIVDGDIRRYGPDDDLPESVARRIGAHCFEDGVHPYDSDGDGRPDGEPPRSGAGSGRDSWAAFAAEKNVSVEDADSRDQIIGKMADAGIIAR